MIRWFDLLYILIVVGIAVWRRQSLALVLVASYGWLLLYNFYLGDWVIDRSGRPVQGDFTSFWAAARLATPAVYEWSNLRAVLEAARGGSFADQYPFFYPPMFLWVLLPLGVLSYAAALMAWLGAGLAAYVAVAQRILPRGGWLWALAAPGCFWAVYTGQNGLLTAALFGLALVQLPTRPFGAGLVFGLLIIKPQLGLMIPLVLLVSRQWRAIAGAVTSALLLTGVTYLTFGAEMFAVAAQAMVRAPEILLQQHGLPWFKIQTVYALLRGLGAADTVAMGIHLAWAAMVVALTLVLWRSRADDALKAASLPLAALAMLPYCCLYDFPLLSITVVFLLSRAACTRGDKQWMAAAFGVVFAAPFVPLALGPVVYVLLGTVVWRQAVRGSF